MTINGRFWLLVEEEPIDMNHGRVIDLRDGVVLDGRTGEQRGIYAETVDGIDILFNEESGRLPIVQLRGRTESKLVDGKLVHIPLPFDVEADSYSVIWSTAAFKTYRAAHPVANGETLEDCWAREDAELELFEGHVPMYGHALRDGPHILAMHRENAAYAI
jgi:hypothetical protein